MAQALRLGAQGRLVLPSGLRHELGLKQGDRLAVRVEEGRIVLERRDDLLRRMQAELREAAGDRSLVDELIAERRQEAERERLEAERDRRGARPR